ncbi:MAG: transglutaminase domain-containing protein [Candidatus Woesearchaeota archaeon]|nr:MAG: transglutaminase domain-containing protein [Candidatus Woesearchaeota archaeon]
MKDLTFLEEGKFSQRDDIVIDIVNYLDDLETTPLESVTDYVSKLQKSTSGKDQIYRKRTASDILDSGFVTGCTDKGLAFVTLTRALGIPTRFVDTFYEPWLMNLPKSEDGKIHGHVFADVFIDGEWKTYEPIKGFTPKNKYFLRDRGKYVEIGKGLDFSEIFIKNPKTRERDSKPTNLGSFKALEDTIKLFEYSNKPY